MWDLRSSKIDFLFLFSMTCKPNCSCDMRRLQRGNTGATLVPLTNESVHILEKTTKTPLTERCNDSVGCQTCFLFLFVFCLLNHLKLAKNSNLLYKLLSMYMDERSTTVNVYSHLWKKNQSFVLVWGCILRFFSKMLELWLHKKHHHWQCLTGNSFIFSAS